MPSSRPLSLFLVTDRWMVQRELLDRASEGGGRERVLLRWRIGFPHHLNVHMIHKFWLWCYLPLQELVAGKMGLKKPSGSKLGIGTILSILSIFGFVNHTDIDNIEKVWNIGTVKKECIPKCPSSDKNIHSNLIPDCALAANKTFMITIQQLYLRWKVKLTLVSFQQINQVIKANN